MTNKTFSRRTSEADTRIVAVGDVHGDLKATLAVLKLAGIIDDDLQWAGDIVDRGPDTIALFKLVRDLEEQATAVGGRVEVLLGNHEILNFMDMTRFVHPDDVVSCGGALRRSIEWSQFGKLGSWLRKRDIATVIDGTLFVHGGITPEYAKTPLDDLNSAARNALYASSMDMYDFDIFVHEKGPLRYRDYADADIGEENVCPLVDETLALLQKTNGLQIERIVVGHTPQPNGRILARCRDPKDSSDPVFFDLAPRVYVIDVAISEAIESPTHGKVALEIIRGKDPATGEHRTISVKALYEEDQEEVFEAIERS
ncbi:hypothetical protein HK102_014016 [Quaeritorhiza haematococci]|nr:hypothetical protein HK102_014016 [Quaeritorhiza haematococci]